MPKRPRQAHVPQQSASRRRRNRRGGGAIDEERVYVSPPAGVAPGVTGDVVARPGAARQRTAARSTAASLRVTALPVYDRGFILDEVRRIAVLSTSLLALIVVLALILR